MAFGPGKNAVIKIEDSGGSLTDVSAYLDTASLSRTAENYDVTTFGKGSHVYIAGLLDGQIPLAGPWDPTIDALLAGTLGLDANSFEYYPAGTPVGSTKPKYSGACLVTKYEISDPENGRVSFSATVQLSDTVTRATS
jgi:hypothetical protein